MDIRRASITKPAAQGTPRQTNVTPPPSPEAVKSTEDKDESLILDGKNVGDVLIGQYLDFLGQRGVSRDDLFQMLDVLLTSGSVGYNFLLFDRIEVELAMRTTALNEAITRRLDEEFTGRTDVSVMRYGNRHALYNLAASLRRYGKEQYSVVTDDDLDAAFRRVMALPYIVSVALVDKLATFDRALAVVTSEWGLQNFTRPASES